MSERLTPAERMKREREEQGLPAKPDWKTVELLQALIAARKS